MLADKVSIQRDLSKLEPWVTSTDVQLNRDIFKFIWIMVDFAAGPYFNFV